MTNTEVSNLMNLGLNNYNALKLVIRARLEGRENIEKTFAGKFKTVEDLVDGFPEWWETKYEDNWHIRDANIMEDWICSGKLHVARCNGYLFAFNLA